MKNLKDLIKENINESIKQSNTVNEAKVDKLFWKWIDALGGKDIMTEVEKSNKNDDEDFSPLYKKAVEIGTTVEQFEEFADYFFEISNEILDIIYDEEDDFSFRGDDSCEYVSWSIPFNGEKEFKNVLKNHNYLNQIANEYQGELIGYAMEVDSYEEYLEDNDVNQDDLKGFK